MRSTIEVPEIVSLCRDDEEQAVGWAMIIPQTNKVVAYIPGRTCAVVTELTARS